MTIEVFYDPLGNIVATPDLHLNGAWVIQHSTKYENRCFFFNTETQATAWCLPPHILGLPAMQTSHSFSSNSSNANSNSVNQIPSLSQNKPFQKNEKEEEDTEPLEPIPPNPTKPISNSSIKNGGGGGGGGLPSIFTPKKILTTSKSTTQLPDISPKSNIRHSVSDPNASQSFLSLDSPISSPASSPKIISSSLSSSPTTSPSTTPIIPKFKVIEGLGRGGYATVVKVQDIYSKKYYAMKVIIKNTSKNYNKRIKHQEILDGELKVMTDIIPSPFLQKCYYSFENPITVFFILELHTGGDLYHHLVQRTKKGKSFSEKEIKIILSELYLAIEHLHKHNIVHRDIKIENVMVGNDGHIKLIDYGLSVTIKNQIEKMSAMGSLVYMAPELLRDKLGGRHTDWWSYGILAYELCFGYTPWSSLDNYKIIKKDILTCKQIIPQFQYQYRSNRSPPPLPADNEKEGAKSAGVGENKKEIDQEIHITSSPPPTSVTPSPSLSVKKVIESDQDDDQNDRPDSEMKRDGGSVQVSESVKSNNDSWRLADADENNIEDVGGAQENDPKNEGNNSGDNNADSSSSNNNNDDDDGGGGGGISMGENDENVMYYSVELEKFISELLIADVKLRLGFQNDIEIKQHAFFKHLDWKIVNSLHGQPCFQPTISNHDKQNKYQKQSQHKQSQNKNNCYHDSNIGFDIETNVDKEESLLVYKEMINKEMDKTFIKGNKAILYQNSDKVQENKQPQVSYVNCWYLGLEKASKYLV